MELSTDSSDIRCIQDNSEDQNLYPLDTVPDACIIDESPIRQQYYPYSETGAAYPLARHEEDFPDERQAKEECYTEYQLNGKPKFQCLVCGRVLSSKQRVLTHLHTKHNKSKYYLHSTTHIHPSIHPSIHSSIHPSIHPSIQSSNCVPTKDVA